MKGMSDLFLFLLEGDAGNFLSRLGTAARSPSIRPTRRKGQMRANGKKSRGKGRTESAFVNWEGSGTNPAAAQSERQRRCAAPREAAAGGAAAPRTAHPHPSRARAALRPTLASLRRAPLPARSPRGGGAPLGPSPPARPSVSADFLVKEPALAFFAPGGMRGRRAARGNGTAAAAA